MEILEGVFVIIEGIDRIGNEVGFFLCVFFVCLTRVLVFLGQGYRSLSCG